ncbi:MAG: hypothetical protein QM613_03875 [Micrococcaceae bacterium]
MSNEEEFDPKLTEALNDNDNVDTDKVQGAVEDVKNALEDVFAKVKKNVGDLTENSGEHLDDIKKNVGKTFDDVQSKIAEAVEHGKVDETFEHIKGTLGGLFAKAQDAIGNVVNGTDEDTSDVEEKATGAVKESEEQVDETIESLKTYLDKNTDDDK